MKQIDLLPLSAEKKKRLSTFAALYKKNAHIIIEVVSFENERLIVRAEQKDFVNGKKLNKFPNGFATYSAVKYRTNGNLPFRL